MRAATSGVAVMIRWALLRVALMTLVAAVITVMAVWGDTHGSDAAALALCVGIPPVYAAGWCADEYWSPHGRRRRP